MNHFPPVTPLRKNAIFNNKVQLYQIDKNYDDMWHGLCYLHSAIVLVSPFLPVAGNRLHRVAQDGRSALSHKHHLQLTRNPLGW
jgi:hypothetical protein